MSKIILKCPHCHKKMKINNKIAKYRCPNCKEIYNYNAIKKPFYSVKNVGVGLVETINDAIYNTKNQFNNMRNTYKYIKQVKQNMKNNPNWSNYEKQRRENMQPKSNPFKNFFKKK